MKKELYAMAQLPVDKESFEDNLLVGWNNRTDFYELYSADELLTSKSNFKKARNGLVNVYNNYDEIIYVGQTADELKNDLPYVQREFEHDGRFGIVKITNIDTNITIEEVA